MHIFDKLARGGHEEVLFFADPASDYRAVFAIHSTRLGPAVGGTRLRRYSSDEEALVDALRLSRGMTYKNAVAGLPLGGGKAVILSSSTIADREALFRAHGRAVERLKGRFITGEDVGTSPADMEIVNRETDYVGGIDGKGGDPSPWTADGVFRALEASAFWRWGTRELANRTVALQGLGNVGFRVAEKLGAAGARLVVTDVDSSRVERAVAELGATPASPEEIYDAEADVFAPCALGGILNPETIPRLRVAIVAGAANNQLLEERDADALAARDVLYAPDFVANAGGVLSGAIGLLGWTPEQTRGRVDSIFETMLRVFERARREKVTTARAAETLAEERLSLR